MPEVYCPVCKYKNEAGVTECILCGTPLDTASSDKSDNPTTNVMVNAVAIETQPVPPLPQKVRTVPVSGIAIYALESDGPIAVLEDKEFMLGRKVESEKEEPFVDLQQIGGYESGVSRHHGMIRRTESGYEIIDLGSTNGTWVEKEHLIPYRSYPLESGTRIILGRLPLLVFFKR